MHWLHVAVQPGLQSLWVMNLGGTLDPSRGHTHLRAPGQGSASSLTRTCGTQGLVAVRLRPPAPAVGTLHGASFTGTAWQLALPDRCGGGSRALCPDHRGAAPLLPRSRHQKQAGQPSPRWGRGLQRVNSRRWGPCEPCPKLRSTAYLFGGPS